MPRVGENLPQRQQHTEGPVARTIEEQTAKIPSDLFLWSATVSIVGSLSFKLMGKNDLALFIGQWAPTFLILGLYNKLVKQLGHEGEGGAALRTVH